MSNRNSTLNHIVFEMANEYKELGLKDTKYRFSHNTTVSDTEQL